jgi:hypothetical protein
MTVQAAREPLLEKEVKRPYHPQWNAPKKTVKLSPTRQGREPSDQKITSISPNRKPQAWKETCLKQGGQNVAKVSGLVTGKGRLSQ